MGTVSKNRGMSCVGVRKTGTTLIRVSTVMGTLYDDLRKKLLTEWQNKKKETLTHPYLKEKIEWGMVPYVQAMLLARYLRGDLDGYPVFLWK